MTVPRSAVCLSMMLLGAVSASAQMSGQWQGEDCGLKTGHFLVNSAVVHLKTAVETKFEDQRQKKLDEAQRALTQAFASGQAENPAAWYYLGRYYLMRGDLLGADTALTRAAQLEPGCAADIAKWRRYYWVPVLNAGIAAWQAGQSDSAIASFRRANTLYRGEPQGLFYLAQLYATGSSPDSAIKYFQLGIEAAGSDTAFAAQRKQAMFNLARMYHREQRWAEAAAAYRHYLEEFPRDAEATAALASVYSAMGQPDSATTLYRGVLERADSVPFLDLMQAGVQMFRNAGQAEGQAARKTYRLAARAFEAALAKNPQYRDGLYNLANVYYQLHDTTRMLPVARRLFSVDPLNRATLQLLAQAFQFAAHSDSALYYLKLANEVLPVDLTVTEIQLRDAGALLKGIVTNLRARRSAALSLVFDFLASDGATLATDTLAVPPLPPQGTQEFQLQTDAEGVAAYRYRRED